LVFWFFLRFYWFLLGRIGFYWFYLRFSLFFVVIVGFA